MNTPLSEYRTYLENLVKEGSSTLFSNGGKDYASILMSILLENTTKSVCMFCEGFKPDLIMELDYWKALKSYLSMTEKTIKVLVNSKDYEDCDPLKLLFKKQEERGDDSIQVRMIDEAGRKSIKEQFNGSLNNFAVFDEKMYRLEYEPKDFKAIGSFNQPDDAKMLQGLFDKVFDTAKPLNGTAA